MRPWDLTIRYVSIPAAKWMKFTGTLRRDVVTFAAAMYAHDSRYKTAN